MTEKQLKIVKIIDEYKIVINGGVNDNIHIGDEFEVYQIGIPVIDPETAEELGTLDPIKAYIEVAHVYPKMCVCTNSDKIRHSLLENLMPLTEQFREAPKKFTVKAEDISGGWSNSRTLTIGDFVRPKHS